MARERKDFTDDFPSLSTSWKAHYGGLKAEEIEVGGEGEVFVMFPSLEPNLYADDSVRRMPDGFGVMTLTMDSSMDLLLRAEYMQCYLALMLGTITANRMDRVRWAQCANRLQSQLMDILPAAEVQ